MIILATAFLFTTVGCGTVANLMASPTGSSVDNEYMPTTPFGGLVRDGQNLAKVWAETDHGGPNQFLVLRFMEDSLLISYALLDFPLSFVGDILTLPMTTYDWIYPRRLDPVTENTSRD